MIRMENSGMNFWSTIFMATFKIGKKIISDDI